MTAGQRPLRILFLLDTANDQGGAERFAIGLARALPRNRFQPWMCATRWARPQAAKQLAEGGIEQVVLGRRGKLDLHRLRGLVSLIRRERFDIVHAHMFGSNFWATVLGRACGVPVVIAHEHNWSYSGERTHILVDRWVIGPLATCLIAVSESNRRRMIGVEHIAAEKIVVLPTAYIPHSAVSDNDIRSELGLSPQAAVVAIAAQLRVEKAHEVLIEAHAEVTHRHPDAHLVIAGDGPRRPELTQLAALLGIEANVHFLGRRRDVSSILEDVDVGVISSDWEGMPLFVLECMVTHTAVVATNVGGLPEMIEDGVTGVLVPPRNPHALGQAIGDLLADPARRRQLAAAAAQRAQPLKIETVAERFAELYERLAQERGVDRRRSAA